ncbi:MAG TPA: PBECR2 nuclease fold domain-containing protein [Chitinophagales bacterium]|nr:PBECR2 nuclease fold domain-containing protein [Chitinophagales bacterium]HRK25970.1 PBECR2 nuclease fold domain-containing protein [Chitinophagales bacterium]
MLPRPNVIPEKGIVQVTPYGGKHAPINGVILPVNHPFWNTYYPPNGWNCRCDVIQLTQDQAEKKGVANEAQAIGVAKNAATQELFELNVGKQKVVFDTNKHPYFTQIQGNPTELSAATNYGMKTIGQIYNNAAQLPAIPQSIIASYADLLAWWKQNADANNNIVVKTGIETIILDQKLLSHMGQPKQRSEKRFTYINEVIAAIRQPNEVWQHFYSPSASAKKQTLTTTFIKYFRSNPTSKNQPILLIKAELTNGVLTVKTFYTAKATDAVGSKHRKGILLKKQ